MDAQVLKAQKWVNKTYGNRSDYKKFKAPENGIPGLTTMWALLLGLQYELGFAHPMDKLTYPNFGPGTHQKFVAQLGAISASTKNARVRMIVECALYCKGYSGGDLNGSFNSSTQAGVRAVKSDMGFGNSKPAVDADVMKSLLTMDAYKLLSGGSAQLQAAQRWLNKNFVGNDYYDIVACDGLASTDLRTALLIALQLSFGLTSAQANGTFGDKTQAHLDTSVGQRAGSKDSGSNHLVTLFKVALLLNARTDVDWGSGAFTAKTVKAAQSFQKFCALPVTGAADRATWWSLLSAAGYTPRTVTAADCSTPLNDARAKALAAAGYTTVGRYVTGGAKALTKAEIAVMAASKLRFFCIQQYSNDAVSYFTKAAGAQQAKDAVAAAKALGIPKGAVIYFAVDYDATVNSATPLLNFFSGVAAELKALGSYYRAGIYGTRYACALVRHANYTSSSFIADMSTGYGGNLGFTLPGDWGFDQIAGATVGSGTAGQLSIDRCAMSGRNPGILASTIA